MTNTSTFGTVADYDAALEKLKAACGPIILEALNDSAVVEILVNPDGKLWIEAHGKGMYIADPAFSAERANEILTLTASMQRATQATNSAIIEGEFPIDGSRVAGLLPPLVKGPTFSLRKRSPSVFSLEDYQQSGIIKPIGAAPVRLGTDIAMGKARSFVHPTDAIREAVSLRKNILIVGGTGSGKTTLTNAVLQEIGVQCPRDRIVAIEDTMELQVSVANNALLRTSKEVDMRALLRVTMRLRPDRIIVGEVRGGEAYTLLKSWNSGHPGGVATMHANSAEEGLQKLAHYIFEDPAAQSFPPETIGWMIASAVNLVVVIEKTPAAPGRTVSEICEVTGYMNDRYNMNVLRMQTSSGRSEFKPRI
ncbi:conjugal transfer protein TrbB [Pandoraea anapnoica]|uniref:Conjugal transfer protein TrbB n=1 Tax=Pandoraea anapnoica TaxID=2508301 RepID=A0A5E5ARP0_9BURK|nr:MULTISPECIES: ATPase, T2SS/T4P/T4SS family [Pandoraea]VVE58358.1 conjugal transfer protein TrbB [Pandoraea iniqua]VVE75235.1 conjugal transfer protein TrbB [Pandoraea anapnoica]